MSLAKPELIHEFYQLGLGELLILHKVDSCFCLCSMNYHNGKLTLKDIEKFSDIQPDDFRPCWEYGLLGALGRPRDYEWSSLTFYGLEHTNIPNMLTDSRHDRLLSTTNDFGDMLLNYTGSFYRASLRIAEPGVSCHLYRSDMHALGIEFFPQLVLERAIPERYADEIAGAADDVGGDRARSE
jgi:hypothetical protein